MNNTFMKNINEVEELNQLDITLHNMYNNSTYILLTNVIIPDVKTIISIYNKKLNLSLNDTICPSSEHLEDISLANIFRLQDEIFKCNNDILKLKLYNTILIIAVILLNRL